METHRITLSDLLSRQCQYRVPLFQRPYVWSQEKQWEPKLQDVAYRARAVIDSQATNVPRQAPGDHFLGAIVTRQAEVFGRQIRAAEVIDGQQRLTTTQVMLRAFFNYLQILAPESKKALAQGCRARGRHRGHHAGSRVSLSARPHGTSDVGSHERAEHDDAE